MIVALLTLPGCTLRGAPLSEPIPDLIRTSELATSLPQPTLSPLPLPNLATANQHVAGTWYGSLGGFYFQFSEIGVLRAAMALEALEDQPDIEGEFWFEESKFFITDDNPLCENSTGIYQVQLLASGNLRFVAIDDKCQKRVDILQGEQSGPMTVNVEYEPVR